jgi:hypothetical protein
MLVILCNISLDRILHLRLVLLRPNVLAAARHSLISSVSLLPASRIENTLRIEVSKIPVQAAVSAVDVLHENLHSASRMMSSNAVFVTLSAATVIVAASLVSDLNVSLDDGSSYGDEMQRHFRCYMSIGGRSKVHEMREINLRSSWRRRSKQNGAGMVFHPFPSHLFPCFCEISEYASFLTRLLRM